MKDETKGREPANETAAKHTCDRCGACCVFDMFFVYATKGDCVRAGHLREFDGIEGIMRRRRKQWSNGHQVCIFLQRATSQLGCALHGDAEKPVDCMAFDCHDHIHRYGDRDGFQSFRAAWREEASNDD